MKVVLLTDYKGHFGSKHFDTPYRSGMDKNLLEKYFIKQNVDIDFVQLSYIANNLSKFSKNDYYVYTSSEDVGYKYKSFIEDVILYMELSGYNVIPKYKYLRANNNKVFMELLRDQTANQSLMGISSKVFGVKEESLRLLNNIKYPIVIKSAEGACGKNVFKAENQNELRSIINKVSNTKAFYYDIKEFVRTFKHRGYIRESRYRNKYIIQNMIPNLKNDWKIYYFGDKYYIFYRPVFKHRGFRASGGGYENYFYGQEAKHSTSIFNYVKQILSHYNVPHASIDIAWDGERYYLIEIQFLYFGTAGIPFSKGFYKEIDNKWVFCEDLINIEQAYADSIIYFLKNYSLGK